MVRRGVNESNATQPPWQHVQPGPAGRTLLQRCRQRVLVGRERNEQGKGNQPHAQREIADDLRLETGSVSVACVRRGGRHRGGGRRRPTDLVKGVVYGAKVLKDEIVVQHHEHCRKRRGAGLSVRAACAARWNLPAADRGPTCEADAPALPRNCGDKRSKKGKVRMRL